MVVTWEVKVAGEWFEKCLDENPNLNCFDETRKRFGYWSHNASYSSCFALWEEVIEYLESKKVKLSIIAEASAMFCGILENEVEYDEQVYEALKEALRNIAEKNEDEIIRAHAKALIELINTAEKLKSSIICSG